DRREAIVPVRRRRHRAAISASAWLLSGDCRGWSREASFRSLPGVRLGQAGRRFESRDRTGGWEVTPLPRTGGAPARAPPSLQLKRVARFGRAALPGCPAARKGGLTRWAPIST